MSDTASLFTAILSLDAYNRGTAPGFKIPSANIEGTQIGTATFVDSKYSQIYPSTRLIIS